MAFKWNMHHQVIGALVTDWSKNPASRPVAVAGKTIIEVLREQIAAKAAAMGVGDSVDDIVDLTGINNINFYDLTPVPQDTMMVIIPHSSDVGASPNLTNGYPLPPFYEEDAFGGADQVFPDVAKPNEVELFRQMRIGDYCVNKCF